MARSKSGCYSNNIMLSKSLTVILTLTLCLPGYCDEPVAQPLEQQAPDMPALTLPAVEAAAHVAAVLLDDSAEIDVLDDEGCYIWQQPGVALTVTAVWRPGESPQLWYSDDTVLKLLENLPGLTVDEPIIYPPEPVDELDFYIEPQVYVLTADASQRRLATYLEHVKLWAKLNGGKGFTFPADEAMQTDIAIVYLDSFGPLEFHFQVGASGKLVLRHLITYDFFSA